MLKTVHPLIQICRVYTPPQEKKGTWILVDKLWPRGLKKEELAFDSWLKEIAPSTTLRIWFHQDPNKRWQEFTKRYIEELKTQTSLLEQIRQLAQQQAVTLFYAAKDKEHNHALVLQSILNS